MRLDLRQRLALSLAGLALLVALLLASLVWLAHVGLERALLDDVFERELQAHLDSGTPPALSDETRSGLRLYRPARWPEPALPAALASLGAGVHRDVHANGHHWHVLVREITPGDRAVLAYDVTALEQREDRIRLALALGLVLVALLSAWAGQRIARRLLAPLASVTARIGALHADRPQALPVLPADGELAVIIVAVNHLLAELQQLVARERAFAGAASHELRTPLASAQIAGEMLAVTGAAPEPLARVQRALKAAGDTLNALLALSRERELPPPETLALAQWVPGVIEPYAALARDQGTRLEFALAPVTREAPAAVLEVILTNLVRNAIRAAPGGTVVIEGGDRHLAVRDDGEGIEPERLAHVFEPGTRGPHGGSGIGLYIARELARRCGWRLELASRPGEGTVATLGFY